MTTTDHQQAAKKLAQELDGLHLRSSFDLTEGAWRGLRALIAIVASIPAPQAPQERPEPAPEGDGTTDPGSGRETGAQRDGSHRPGHAFTPAVEPPPLAPGHARITMHDTTVDWPQASGMRIQTIGSDYLRFVADGRPAGAPSRMPSEPETGARRFAVGDRVRVRDFGAATVVTANGNYRTVRINGAVAEYHVSWLRPWTEPTPGPVDLPTTPGSVAWPDDLVIEDLAEDTLLARRLSSGDRVQIGIIGEPVALNRNEVRRLVAWLSAFVASEAGA